MGPKAASESADQRSFQGCFGSALPGEKHSQPEVSQSVCFGGVRPPWWESSTALAGAGLGQAHLLSR